MKLDKAKGLNIYTWRGLSLGKLMAIQNALDNLEERAPVEEDVLIFLQQESLKDHKPKGELWR